MRTAATWRLDRRVLIAIVSLALLASVAVTAAWALNPAGAQNPPDELTLVCIHQGSDKISVLAVDSPAECNANNETLFVLPGDGPINACAQANNGLLRYVGSQTSCSGNDIFVAFPGAGPTYLCAGSGNGDLRLVSAPSQCSSTETPYVVSPANAAPDALDQAVNVDEDDAVVVTLEATDPDGDALTFAITDGPDEGSLGAIGSVSCDGNTPSTCSADVTYTPDPGYNGPDSFTFTATDSDSLDDTAAVSITVDPVNDAPVVAPKAYEAHTHLSITIPAADGLLDGATDPDDGVGGFTAELTVSAGPTTPAADLTVNADGSFTLHTPAAFTGGLTFDYTVCDNGNPLPAECSTETATVTIDGPVIWFVDDDAAPAGSGTQASPFDTLADADAVIDAESGHRIFLHEGTYAGGIELNEGGWLIGQGTSGASFDDLFAITPPAETHPRPAISGAAPTVGGTVTLHHDTVVSGIALDTGASTALTDPAGATNGVTVDEVSITTTTGSGVVIDGLSVAGAFNVSGLTKSGAGGVGISLTGGSGAFNFDAVSVTNATGVALTGNAAATVSFDGLALDTGANPAFAAAGSGTVTVTGSANTIATTTATALRVEDTTIGAAGLTFQSISADGASSGIVLDSTGATAGLTVTGTGAAGSGGSIENTTGVGILLTATQHVSLSSMTVENAGDDGIRGQGVHNFALLNSTITGSGDAVAENGLQFGEAAGSVPGITGALTLTNTTISGSAGNNVHIRNTTGTLAAMTITGGGFNDLSDLTGANSFLFEMVGDAETTVATIDGTSFLNNSPQRGLEVRAQDTAAIGSFTVANGAFTENGIHVSFTQGATANLTFAMLDNEMTFANPLHAINVSSSSTSTGGAITGTIQGNTIGDAAQANSGARGNGIRVLIQGQTAATLLIDDNTLRQIWDPFSGSRGIDVQFLGTTAGGQPITQSDVTVTNNDVDTMAPASTFPLAAIYIAADDQGSPARVRADITGNTAQNSVGGGTYDWPSFDGNGAHLIFLEAGSGAEEGQLVDTPPASADATAQLQSANPGTAAASVYAQGIDLIPGPINLP